MNERTVSVNGGVVLFLCGCHRCGGAVCRSVEAINIMVSGPRTTIIMKQSKTRSCAKAERRKQEVATEMLGCFENASF